MTLLLFVIPMVSLKPCNSSQYGKYRAANSRPFSFFAIKLILLAPALLIIDPINVTHANAYFEVDTFTYVEPVTIDSMMNEWDRDFSRGEDALTYNRIEIGFNYKGTGVGYLKRYDYSLKFSEDTSEFYYLIENKMPLPAGKQYDLAMNVKHAYSDGIRVNRSFAINRDVNTNVAISYLRGLWLTEGKLKGAATIIDANDYDFDFYVDYAYSEDALFDRRVDEPDGQGYSIDIDVDWQISSDTKASVQVLDLFAEIRWNNAPVTTANATSDTKEYDSDGYVIYNPVLTGYEKYENFTQRLPRKITVDLSHSLSAEYSLLLNSRFYDIRDFHQIGVQYNKENNTYYSAFYMLEVDAISLGFQNQYIRCLLTSDAINFDKSHLFAFQIQVLAVF